jgi:hypothetical protein
MNTLAKKVPIPRNARLKTYYDTKEIVQNTAEYNFFPPNATRNVSRDNYINNPFPGEDSRRVVGLSFELVPQFMHNDAANGIDVEAIINGLKDAGIILTADNDYKEFVRTTMSEHFNFAGTRLNTRVSGAPDVIGAGAVMVPSIEKTVVAKAADMYRLPDPFDVAPNQTIDLKVVFDDASMFPTSGNWTTSGQSRLLLRANLFIAEVKPEKV